MVRERLLATVSMAFSLLALLLTAIGLHGLLSYWFFSASESSRFESRLVRVGRV